LVPGPDRAEHEPRPVGRRHLVGDLAGQPRALLGELADPVGDVVVGQVGQVRAERVGLDGVGAGLEVGAVDVADHVRAGGVEDLVAALEAGEVVEHQVAALPGVLEHRAHRAVGDEDALVERVEEASVGCGSHPVRVVGSGVVRPPR
jgi:hypothetical protein